MFTEIVTSSEDFFSMCSPSAFVRQVLTVTLAAGAIVMTSCGTDDGLGKRYAVSGTVNYNGKPLEKGTISFIPEDPKKEVGATGIIENGAYKLSTGGDNDGAQAGNYKVTVASKEDSAAKAKADFDKARAALPKGSSSEDRVLVPKQFLSKAEAEAKSLIPLGYSDSTTTTLKAEVKAQSSNPIDFELSDANAPPEPKTAHKGATRGRGHP